MIIKQFRKSNRKLIRAQQQLVHTICRIMTIVLLLPMNYSVPDGQISQHFRILDWLFIFHLSFIYSARFCYADYQFYCFYLKSKSKLLFKYYLMQYVHSSFRHHSLLLSGARYTEGRRQFLQLIPTLRGSFIFMISRTKNIKYLLVRNCYRLSVSQHNY